MSAKSTPSRPAAAKPAASAPAAALAGAAQIQPYLFFNGRCEEAVEFYRRAVGAEVKMLMRFSDSPEPPPPGSVPAGSEHKVMHGEIRIGGSSVLVSDGRCQGEAKFEGFSLSLTVASVAESNRAFAALAEGGRVEMPLTKTFFSPSFGMLEDRFGVGWMVYVVPEAP